jgi:hypothetical protein
MTTYPKPVSVGQFGPFKATDVIDLYIDIAADLAVGETVTGAAFTVTDAAGTVEAGVVGSHTETGSRTDFRLTVPAAGSHTITTVFTISDGQQITKVADLWVV